MNNNDLSLTLANYLAHILPHTITKLFLTANKIVPMVSGSLDMGRLMAELARISESTEPVDPIVHTDLRPLAQTLDVGHKLTFTMLFGASLVRAYDLVSGPLPPARVQTTESLGLLHQMERSLAAVKLLAIATHLIFRRPEPQVLDAASESTAPWENLMSAMDNNAAQLPMAELQAFAQHIRHTVQVMRSRNDNGQPLFEVLTSRFGATDGGDILTPEMTVQHFYEEWAMIRFLIFSLVLLSFF